MSKKIISLFIMVFILAAVSGCKETAADAPYQEQYDLGMRYLEEGKYEEAILAFNAALEIDTKQPMVYTGLAEAYIGLGKTEEAIAALERGLEETGDGAISEQLEELLSSPHRFSRVNAENGNTEIIFGQTDLEGRLQGFCIINEFDGNSSQLRYLAEGEFVDGRPEGELKNWWFPDENINQDYGVENGCGRGAGEYSEGERNGYNTVECYIGYSVPEAQEGEMIRWDDCSGTEPVYTYSGGMVNGEEHDETGEAYLMYVSHSEDHWGQKVEYIGQMQNGHRTGYGKQWRDGILDHDGLFEDSSPVR